MHPLFVDLFIHTHEEVLAEDDERRNRRARRRRKAQVRTAAPVRTRTTSSRPAGR